MSDLAIALVTLCLDLLLRTALLLGKLLRWASRFTARLISARGARSESRASPAGGTERD
ncbi:hypothetical protein [Chitinolyticbacter meiyuanensis]|uniref:hypothetical protein n=1 Tax=Chitinolyticbacter meiyuanensis TaxID=682798 RepID=UPI001652960C|nr:hypothetical protein [Chitinolyticbacter meiyuanensis]